MLFFLYHTAKFGAVVDRYEDAAEGILEKNAQGRSWISRVTLRPSITWGSGTVPSPTELETLHHKAHEDCYLANSVKTEITIQAV